MRPVAARRLARALMIASLTAAIPIAALAQPRPYCQCVRPTDGATYPIGGRYCGVDGFWRQCDEDWWGWGCHVLWKTYWGPCEPLRG